jgi:hypothetical protein
VANLDMYSESLNVYPEGCVARNYMENTVVPKEKMNIAVSGDEKDSTFVHGD